MPHPYEEYRRAYYLRNRNMIIQQSKQWNKNNEEHVKQYKKDYYQKNRETLLEKQKEKKALKRAESQAFLPTPRPVFSGSSVNL
jgi:hypothetical protein